MSVGGPTPGDELGGYRIQAVIGRGGMGVVYRAEHMTLGRTVALKVVAPELAADPGFRERFLREARLAASLDHPAIIPVHDAGEERGVLFIAMRLVTGPDLGTVLRGSGSLPTGRTGDVLAPVASALDVAHRRGLVHRDVKPGNILVEPPADSNDAERVFLTDFGLTKRTDSLTAITRTGMFVGTLQYAAPEQIRGEPVDGRSDQYALACVVFQCVTGRLPFGGESDVQMMYGHLSLEPPPATSVRPDLPAGLDPVLARGLAKAPGERFPSCMDLIQGLREALAPVRTRLVPPPAAVAPTRPAPPPTPFAPPMPAAPSVAPIPGAPWPPPQPATWPPPQPATSPWPEYAGSAPAPGPRASWKPALLVALAGILGLVAVSGAHFDEPGPGAALLAGPQLILAALLAISRGRAARLTWSGLAALTGVFDVVVAAGVSETPFSIEAVGAAVLALAGAVGGFRSAPGPAKPRA